jgi:hypothetical protein
MPLPDLSDLADTGPSHNTATMPFNSVDVAVVARQIEKKPTWLSRTLFGLHPRGIAHLLRKLWFAEQKAANEAKRRTASWLQACEQIEVLSSATHRVDRLLPSKGSKKTVVILMSEREFDRLDDEYICPDKGRTTTGERWAYTYKGWPVYTGRGFNGIAVIESDTFASIKDGVAGPLTLIEK